MAMRKAALFQFSLRGFLVVVAAICVWLAYATEGARRQHRAVAVLDPIASIAYDDDEDADGLPEFQTRRERQRNSRAVSWLEARLGKDYFHRVIGVMILRQHIEPQHLMAIRELRSIRYLELAACESVDDRVLAQLCKLPHLYDLSLNSASITDDALRYVSHFNDLEWLDLTATQINGSGFKHLNELPRLSALSLYATAVDDQHLDELAELRTLEVLYLGKTHVTTAGVTRLREALPNCEIRWPD